MISNNSLITSYRIGEYVFSTLLYLEIGIKDIHKLPNMFCAPAINITNIFSSFESMIM